MNATTKEVLDAIRTTDLGLFVASTLSYCFGSAATSAALKIAKRDGLIEIAYFRNGPVYRKVEA